MLLSYYQAIILLYVFVILNSLTPCKNVLTNMIFSSIIQAF